MTVVLEHAHEAEFLRPGRSDQLFLTRNRPWNDDRPLVERQDLAEGVVPPHGDDPHRIFFEPLDARIEDDRLDTIELGGTRHELGLFFGLKERSQNEQRRIGQHFFRLVGAQHPFDQHVSIPAAARRDQQERTVGDLRGRSGKRGLGDGNRQVARVGDFALHVPGQRQTLQGFAYLRQAVDPNLVVALLKRRKGVFAFPLDAQSGRIVEDVPQSKHETLPSGAQHFQGASYLSAQPQRFLVDDKHVGVENVGGVLDDGGPHRERFLQVQLKIERRVFPVAQLDDARHADEVHATPKIEAANDGGAGKYQDGQILVTLDQRVGDRPTAA